MKTRKEIDNKYKIDLSEIFQTEKDFYKAIEDLNSKVDKYFEYKGKILESANKLYEVLEFDNNISKDLESLFIYANINQDFDLTNSNSNTMYGNVLKLENRLSVASSYIVPEILKTDYSLIEKYYEECPSLKEYELNLKEIFRLKEHILSEKEETLIQNIKDSFRLPEEAHSMLFDADLKYGKIKDEDNKIVELTSANYANYLESKDRTVRKNAFKKFYKGIESVINTSSQLYSSYVKSDNSFAKLKKYQSALSMALENNNVDQKVYNTLIKSLHENKNILHKQWLNRKNYLQLDKLHIYDTYVSLVEDYDKKYSFEDAKKVVLNSLSILGDDYKSILEKAFNENWIDVYPSPNKRSGGYCTCCYKTHPYVFLNFDSRYDEVSTIAHELGHAMHYYYAQTNQKYQDYNYSIFVAEVASQVNELLLSYYMLDNTNDRKERLFIIDELIKRFKASVVRQTMFAEFEKKMHEDEEKGTILTKDYLCDEYLKLNKYYYGKDVSVDKEIKYEWSRIPHFFYNFYVYQYSTGYIAAIDIANRIYNKDTNALENYKKFLSLGSTLDPVESLKIAGTDLSDKKVYDKAFANFEELLDKFDKEVNNE